EIAGVSREGCRQLLFATGQLPRHVALPGWVLNGSANFFYRPKGPVFTTTKEKSGGSFGVVSGGVMAAGTLVGTQEKTTITVATSTGYGVPNYVYQKHFRDMLARKELNQDPATLLRNVLTDAYFIAMKEGDELDPPPPPPPG